MSTRETITVTAEMKTRGLEGGAKRAKKKIDKLKGGIDGLRKGAAAAQGPIGGMTSRFLDAGEAAASLAKAIGPVGVGAAALVVGVGAAAVITAKLTAALLATVAAAVEAEAKLEKLRAQGVDIASSTGDFAIALDDAEDSSTELGFALTQLTAIIGAQLAPVALKLTNAATLGAIAISEITLAIQDAEAEFGPAIDGVDLLASAFMGSSGLSMAVGGTVRAVADLIDMLSALAGLGKWTDQMDAATIGGNALKKSMEENAKAIKAIDEAAEKTGKTVVKVVEEVFARLETFETSSEGGLLGNLFAFSPEIQQGLLDKVDAFQAEVLAKRADHFAALADQEAAAAAESRARTLTSIQMLADGMAASAGGVSDLLEQIFSSQGEMTQKQFDTIKKLRVAEAIINGISATMQALASFPGPPVTIPLAVGVAASAAAQVAQISQQTLHSGGTPIAGGGQSPDETMARIRRNETVLTRQQMQSMGGGGGTVIEFKLKHKSLQQVTADNMRRGTGRTSTASRRGQRVGHGGRRGR